MLYNPETYVPTEDEGGTRLSGDEYVHLCEFVDDAELHSPEDIVKRCYEELRIYRDVEGLLGKVPRKWAGGNNIRHLPLHRMLSRVRREANTERDVVRIVLEEGKRWQREKPHLWSEIELTEEVESLARTYNLNIEDFWYHISGRDKPIQ